MSVQIKDAGLKFASPLNVRESTTMIILHHAASNSSVQAVHIYHRDTRKHKGIDYNFYVAKDGTIYNGRGLEYEGGHVLGNLNKISIGICVQGNYDIDKMPEAQKQAVIDLIKYCMKKYPTITKIYGHKELKSVGYTDQSVTACPGKNYPLAEIKADALMTEVVKPKPPIASKKIYYVRKTWEDKASQIGAFTVFENAKVLADQKGYTVFDESGTKVYSPAKPKVTGKTKVTTKVYKTASTTSAVLLNIANGTSFEIVGASGSFYKVVASGKTGFILGAHVTVTSGTAPKIVLFYVGKLLRKTSSTVPNQDVKEIQLALQNEGYAIKADGLFGSKTEAAVKDFQRKAGLKVDGIVGKNTVTALGGTWTGK